jgi:ERCC4-type nuclease
MIQWFKYTDKQRDALLSSINILVDSREQQNKHITDYFDKKNIQYSTKALSYGDYSFFIPQNNELDIPRDLYFDKEIAVERKGSLEELSGNFSQQRDRFEKELSLFHGRMFLLIENANYQDICDGNYKTQYNKKSYIGSLHSFCYKYDLPFIFMPNNEYSAIYIYGTFYYYLKNIIK